jgi:hypothetical protein
MSTDKRTVSTDALETLGMIHTREEKRDAIHLAVLPIEAAYHLNPGTDVQIGKDGRAQWGFGEEAVGIVDPFLKAPVKAGERFWLVLYPRVITSLRHVWSHPSIPDEIKTSAPVDSEKEQSRKWLMAYAVALFSYHGVEYDDEGERVGESPQARGEECLRYLLENVESGFFGTDIEYGESVQPSDELWFHFERYTGRKPSNKPEHFRCAC